MAERIKVTVAVLIVGSFLMGPVLAQQPSVESIPRGRGSNWWPTYARDVIRWRPY